MDLLPFPDKGKAVVQPLAVCPLKPPFGTSSKMAKPTGI